MTLKNAFGDLNLESTQQDVKTSVQAVTTSLGTDGATPPSIAGTGVRGWLRAIYDRLVAGIGRTWNLSSGSDSVNVGNFPAVQAINDSTDTEWIPVATTVTTIGDTTVYTPASGKRIRLHWIYAINDPVATSSTKITVKIGAVTYYVAWAISKRQQFTGAVNAPLVINLSAAGNVAVTAFVEEI